MTFRPMTDAEAAAIYAAANLGGIHELTTSDDGITAIVLPERAWSIQTVSDKLLTAGGLLTLHAMNGAMLWFVRPDDDTLTRMQEKARERT